MLSVQKSARSPMEPCCNRYRYMLQSRNRERRIMGFPEDVLRLCETWGYKPWDQSVLHFFTASVSSLKSNNIRFTLSSSSIIVLWTVLRCYVRNITQWAMLLQENYSQRDAVRHTSISISTVWLFFFFLHNIVSVKESQVRCEGDRRYLNNLLTFKHFK